MIKKRVCGNKLNKKGRKLVRSNHSEDFTIRLCSDSEVNIPQLHMKESPFARDHLKFCGALQNAKIVPEGLVSRKYLVSKVMKMVVEHCSGAAIVVGSDLEIDIRRWLLLGRHCGNRSSASSVILAVHRGKLSFKRRSILKPRGFKLELRPRVYFCENIANFRYEEVSVTGNSESKTSTNVCRHDSGSSKYDKFHCCKEESVVRPMSREVPESILGWPLRKTTPMSHDTFVKSKDADTLVVQWVMSLPHRSNPAHQQISIHLGDSFNGKSGNSIVEKQEIEGKSQSSIQSDKGRNLDDESCSLVDEISLSSSSTIFEQSDQGSPLLRVASSRLLDSTKELDSDSKYEASSSLVSTFFEELPEYAQGWPLLLLAGSRTPDPATESQITQASVSQRIMNQLNLSAPITEQSDEELTSNIPEDSAEGNISCPWIRTDENYSTPPRKLPNTLELLLGRKSSTCRWFSYEELKIATSLFCPENLIGEGGCSNVYKGVLPSGKLVAVKMLKPYKEAWNDFCLEISILSTLNHKHITPLIGVCIEDGYLISAYEFFHRGSLEESLHGEKSVLTWNSRFNVAIKVADSLNYLHNECPRPVIHRDVKSSNILLSNKLQPQLSDFGLSIWGPTDSTYLIDNDVAGTLGYIAPEYFMHGRASDKIDVYSYGVVLLELLSGRRPIASNAPNGQESLVKWAKPLLETTNLKKLVDPKLDGNFDIVQAQRMIQAAKLCINQSAGHRPKMNQILKLLRGEEDAKALSNYLEKTSDEDNDYCQPHLNVALIDDDITIASPRIIKRRRRTLKDHLEEPH